MSLRSVGDFINFIGLNDLIYKGEIKKIKGELYEIKLLDNYYPYTNNIWVQEQLIIKNNNNSIITLIKHYSNKATLNPDNEYYSVYAAFVSDLWGVYNDSI